MFDTHGNTNARIARNRIPQWDFPTFDTDQVARTFVEGPDHIYVYETPDDYSNSGYYDGYNPCDLCFRFSTQSNKNLRTWAIYGDFYTGVDRCLLRYANWNLEKKQEESEQSIEITTRYIDYDLVESLYKQWEVLLSSLRANILPETNQQPNQDILPSSEWEKCTLFLHISAVIELRWLKSSTNDKLRESALALAMKIEEILLEHQANYPEPIEALVMMYDKPNPQALAYLKE